MLITAPPATNQAPKPCPPPPAILTEHIVEYLVARHGMRKPPVVAGGLLALILQLHTNKCPFPPRAQVAALLGCTSDGVDAALSTALSRGLISPRMEIRPGSVERRESAVRVRYYDPAPELLELMPR